MEMKLSEIAEMIGGELIGNHSVIIRDVAQIENAKEGEISFIAHKKYFKFLSQTNASGIIVPTDIVNSDKNIIKIKNPYVSFIKLVQMFRPLQTTIKIGIDERAVIGNNCRIENDASIAAYAVLEDDVTIRKGAKIFPGVYLGRKVVIDEDAVIYPNASILRNVFIGKRVIIHSGTVIGSDGFGFIRDGEQYMKIPHTGIVVIENDVEIGANCTIDRATIGETRIKKGCKIDNLIHIAHNVIVGENTVMAAQVGISGSTTIGKDVQIGGQAGFIHHLKIGDRVQVGAQSGVINSLPDDTCIWGTPAKKLTETKKLEIYLRKIPDLFKRVKSLEKKKKS